jgi:C_GCAxxG_C_C family probable redox protein
MSRADRAVESFTHSFNCAQATLFALSDAVGLNGPTALRLGACFGAGMHRGATCGAVTGALMALGARLGHDVEGDVETKRRAYAAGEVLQDRFTALFGSTNCPLLLEGDPMDPAQRERIEVLWRTRCPAFVRAAVELAEELLAE